MLLLILFVLGTCVGSFLNVCIWRLPRGESVVEPPSHCPRCNTRLQALDLVPLWSQVLLNARCRYCGNSISWRYFGIEFLTGVLFVMVGLRPGNLTGDSLWSAAWTGDAIYLLQLLVVVSCLVVIFWIDYETFLIPLSAALMIGLAGVAGDAWRVSQGMASLTDGALIEGYPLLPAPLPASVLAMVVTAAFLWLLRELFSRIYGQEAMGFGDVFLVASIAANIGWSALLGTFFFLSVMLGAVIGVALRIPRAVRAYRWAMARATKTASRREQTDAVAASTQQTSATDAGVPLTSASNDEIVMNRAETVHVETVRGEPAGVAVDINAVDSAAVHNGVMHHAGSDGYTSANAESVEGNTAFVQGVPVEGAPIEPGSSAAVEPPSEGASSTHASSILRRVDAQTLAWPLVRHAFRRSIPFGPMLAVGAIVTLLYGAQLNESYLNWVNNIGKTSTNSARYEAEISGAVSGSRSQPDTMATRMHRQASYEPSPIAIKVGLRGLQ